MRRKRRPFKSTTLSSMMMERIPNSPSHQAALGTTTSMPSWTPCVTAMMSRKPRPGLATTLKEISGSNSSLRRAKRVINPKRTIRKLLRVKLKRQLRTRRKRQRQRLKARRKKLKQLPKTRRRPLRKRARSQRKPRMARTRRARKTRKTKKTRKTRRMERKTSATASTCAETSLAGRNSTHQPWSNTPKSSWTRLITTTSTAC